VHEAVERGEKRGAFGHRCIVHVRVRVPLAFLERHAECAAALLGKELAGLAQRHSAGIGPPALGEIPEPLSVAPADDGEPAS